jgi:hypothetical protein
MGEPSGSWIRNDPGIAPDWLRVGTDVIGNTTFNASFEVGLAVDQSELFYTDGAKRPAQN